VRFESQPLQIRRISIWKCEITDPGFSNRAAANRAGSD
jgi:hypothetical protein